MHKITLAALALAALFPVSAPAQEVPEKPAAAMLDSVFAPDFLLKNQKGEDVYLRQFRGKWVVLYFYPKDFTSGCSAEALDFQNDQPEYEKRNAVVIGISADDVESHKKFAAAQGLGFNILSDTDGETLKAYRKVFSFYNGLNPVTANRLTMIISPQGVPFHFFNDVRDPATHSAHVLTALDGAIRQKAESDEWLKQRDAQKALDKLEELDKIQKKNQWPQSYPGDAPAEAPAE